MSQRQLRPDFDRRHPRLSYEELRRQLLDADQERYRLRSELRAPAEPPKRGWAAWPDAHRRAALGAGLLLVTSLAGGVAWQMCTSAARAADRVSVRVQETTVVARVVSAQIPETQTVEVKAAVKSAPPIRRARPRAHSVVQVRRERTVPRPLSPGEFGRSKVVAY
jgi:hypothetical protein